MRAVPSQFLRTTQQILAGPSQFCDTRCGTFRPLTQIPAVPSQSPQTFLQTFAVPPQFSATSLGILAVPSQFWA